MGMKLINNRSDPPYWNWFSQKLAEVVYRIDACVWFCSSKTSHSELWFHIVMTAVWKIINSRSVNLLQKEWGTHPKIIQACWNKKQSYVKVHLTVTYKYLNCSILCTKSHFLKSTLHTIKRCTEGTKDLKIKNFSVP